MKSIVTTIRSDLFPTHLLLAALIYLFLSPVPAYSQENFATNWAENGIPHIQNFRPRDYRAGTVNQSITQDSLGLIYVANGAGVLVYDGVEWRLIKLPENMPARSLCNANGTIYVGGSNDLGYLSHDEKGALQFVSLKDFVPDSLRDFKSVGECIPIGNDVFFRAYYALFRWNGKTLQAWKPKTLFHTAMSSGTHFFVREWKIGLKQLVGDSLKLPRVGDFFIQKGIAGIFPAGAGKFRILTRFDGWFEIDANNVRPLSSPADEFLKSSLVFRALQLPGDRYALATHRRGLAIIDSSSTLLQIIDRQSGLRDNTINYIYRDAQDGLWLALADGLARVETPSPYSIFAASNGLEGNVNAVFRYRGDLFAATRMGAFALNPGIEKPAQFETLPGIGSTAHTLSNSSEHLLAGGHRGVYEIAAGEAKLLPGTPGVTKILASQQRPDWLYKGTYRTLSIIENLPGRPLQIYSLKKFSDYVVSIAEDTHGNLWVGGRKALHRLKLPNVPLTAAVSDTLSVTSFDSLDGRPLTSIHLANVAGEMRFATRHGLYRYRPNDDRIVPDSSWGDIYADSTTRIYRIAEGQSGTIWISGRIERQRFCRRISTAGASPQVLASLSPVRLQEIGGLLDIYPDDDGTLWLSGTEGLLRFQPEAGTSLAAPLKTLIRRVESADTLIFAGGSGAVPPDAAAALPFSANALRFQFAATDYQATEALRYRYQLAGFDRGWSDWRVESHRDYTSLPPGDFQFRVQAKSGDGELGQEAVFAFTILPPWYRTTWAYLLYFLLAIGLISAIVQWRVRQLRGKNRRLESLVAERTQTIREQAEKLEEMDRVKSRFFANISHEFRTPLTMIIGPLEDWLESAKDASRKTDLERIQRNARRLLHLINQLLDLSRLEAGKLKLKVSPGDLPAFMKGIVMSFASLAEQKQIALKLEENLSNTDIPEYYFDSEKLETIIVNLLSNAFKFTPKNGKINVECRTSNAEFRIPNSEFEVSNSQTLPWLKITVNDTGRGIPPEDLPFIFDRFYQTRDERGATREGPGSGIGLALTKELVELHHGKISVESVVGKGSRFILHIPVSGSAYLPEEIAETPGEKQPLSTPLIAMQTNDIVTPVADTEKKDLPIILLVEDHGDVRRYIREHLQEQFRVVESADGKSGFQQALTDMPDLIISDVMMPGMDGYQLCAKLKQDVHTSHIPVILLTAKAGEESKLSGLESGADDYLTKPFNSRELKARVKNLIEQRRKLREIYRQEGLLQPSPVEMPSTEQAFIEGLMKTVEAEIESETFGPEALSAALNMSQRHLQRKIRALTGQRPADFIRTIRLRRAKQLLEQHAGNVSEVAYQAGFNNLSYFARCFKKEFGQTPSAFLKSKL